MTREMAEQMKGEEPARELAGVCLAEFDRWADNAVRQAVGLHRGDAEAAARGAVQDLRTDLDDYLALSLSTALTALRLQGALETEEGSS